MTIYVICYSDAPANSSLKQREEYQPLFTSQYSRGRYEPLHGLLSRTFRIDGIILPRKMKQKQTNRRPYKLFLSMKPRVGK